MGVNPMRQWFRPFTVLISFAVLAAQQPPELQILVIGGEGSINNVKQRTAREPVIEVRDRNNRPVAGALVLFEAPRSGASGTFIGGSPTLRVTTDPAGRAVGQGFRPNNVGGDFGIQVSASHQGATATTTIHMTNFVGAAAGAGAGAAAAGHGKLIGILIGIGAAAAAGTAYAVTHSGSSSSSNPGAPVATPTTITAGTGTVGGRP
jgi:hypothetical protein